MIVKFSPSVDATVEPRHQNQSDTYLSFFFYKIQFFICKKTKSTPNVKCLNTSSKTKTFKSGTIWSKSIDKLQSSIFGICQAENIKGERQLHGHSWPYYKNDCSCWSVASSLLIAVSCFFAVFHLNLIVSTPEAKSLNYAAVYSSLNDTSCLCARPLLAPLVCRPLLAMFVSHSIKARVQLQCINAVEQVKRVQTRVFQPRFSKPSQTCCLFCVPVCA